MSAAWAASFAVLIVLLSSSCDDPSSLQTSGPRRRISSTGTSSSSSGVVDEGSSSGGSDVVGTGSTLNEVCWSTINEHRKKDGLPPLARWTEIEACSDGEAQSDGQSNNAHGSFPKCGEFAQNECPGFDGPAESALTDCLAFMYKQPKGEGHHENMASTKWKKVGCGVFVTSGGSFWSVQNFR